MIIEPKRARVTWTYADYRLMPDDGNRHEIIDGELFVTPAPTTIHQAISKRLQFHLMLQLEETGRGIVFNAPVDVLFSTTRTVQPDLLVLHPTRRNIVTKRAIEGAPDLIIEILSPGTAERDQTLKRKLYASEGVREYWLVDPDQHTVEVMTLQEEDYDLHGRFGPGDTVTSVTFALTIPVDPIFAP